MDRVLRVILFPVLVAQAISVRRSALRLPEPIGPRSGDVICKVDHPPLRILIAGDSSAAGVGVSTQAEALSGQLAAQLSCTHAVHWRLLATNGHRTADTLLRLQQEPTGRDVDVVVLALGVNDVTRLTSKTRFHMEQSALINLLKRKYRAKLIILCGVPPMARFPALSNPLAWVLGQHAARLDQVLARLAETQADVLHLPFQIDLSPDMAARDGYHPSARAYRLWAEVLCKTISGWGPPARRDASDGQATWNR